jgi:benzil reductase ((S)-benzoin forming)
MPQSLFILTGASRGMGEAIARQLLQPGHTVLGISRSVNGALAQQAQSLGATFEQWPQDLARAEPPRRGWRPGCRARKRRPRLRHADQQRGLIPRIAPSTTSPRTTSPRRCAWTWKRRCC